MRQLQKHQTTNTLTNIINVNVPITLKKAQNRLRKAIKGQNKNSIKNPRRAKL